MGNMTRYENTNKRGEVDKAGMKKSNESLSSPKVADNPPVDKNGLPIHTFNVPGVSRKAGTPGWVSGPANAAARKAK